MQAVILAAGQSSRIYPFSNGMHKSMIKIMGKPLIEHTVEGVKRAGIEKIIIVVRNDGIIKEYLEDGKRFGLSITYVVQDKAQGMGDALLRAKKFLDYSFILLGSHHVNCDLLIKSLVAKNHERADIVLLTKKRDDYWNFGAVSLTGDRVTEVLEKPEKGKKQFEQTLVSIYLLSSDFILTLENTDKHQYSFEEALDKFTKQKKVVAAETKEEITTLKYPWHILNVKNYLLKTVKRSISKKAKIAKNVQIFGEVVIEDGVEIFDGARIKGPCYIGRNVFVGDNALLRNGADIEEGSVIGSYMEIKNSLIMSGSTTHSGFIGDSVVGENTKIGAQFCTANVRLNRETVKVVVAEKLEDSGIKLLGAFIGSNVKIGIKSSTMPGVIIGNNSVIGPSTTVLKNVGDNTTYSTRFQEIREERHG